MICLLLSGCGKEESNKKKPDVTSYEHKILDTLITDTPKDTKVPEASITPEVTSQPTTAVIDGQTFTPVNDEVYISASKVNLRKGPSTEYDVVIQAKSGDTFTRTGKGDKEWDQLLYEGETVYVYSSYIEKVSGSDTDKLGGTTQGNSDMGGLTVVDVEKSMYTYDEMCEDITVLSQTYPDKMKVNKLTTTKDGRWVYEIVIGNEQSEKNIIVQAAIHAREYMTSQLVMKQLEYYLARGEVTSYNNVSYSELFDSVAIHIIPMVNPDGVSISQLGLDGIKSNAIKESVKTWYNTDVQNGATSVQFSEYLTRFKANANGVDLNRNFEYGWDSFKGKTQPGAEKYKGSAPGSEPESAALIALTERLNPVAAISYHASGSVLYWDYGQTGTLREECLELANLLNKQTGYEIKYAQNDPQDAAGYGDFVVMTKNIPSVTIEIGTNAAPLEINEFQSIFDKNFQVFAALAYKYR